MTIHAKHHDTSIHRAGETTAAARADGAADPDAWTASSPPVWFPLRLALGLASGPSLVAIAVLLGIALVGVGIVPVSLAATWLLVGGCLLMHAFMGHGGHAGHAGIAESPGRDRDGSDSQRGIS